MNIPKKVIEDPINSLKPRGSQHMSVVCARRKEVYFPFETEFQNN